MKEITTGSDFSGVGAFDYAMNRVSERKGFTHKRIFACDMDKFARQSYIANHGEPEYYPENVYNREIPKESLDIFMTSPPCQAFSLAGKRKGESDDRGVLFYNSHEFIRFNRPRFFIFENVKGLLSDDNGRTFQRWIDYLGGKSVNGNPVIFPHENSTPYHVYYKVLNSKEHGVPQNRERVFIVGIRDDEDNRFTWPKEEFLEKRLRDVLEKEVDEKYFLSEKALNHLVEHKEKHDAKGTGFGVNLKDSNSVATTIRANGALCPTENHIKIKSATQKGYETAQTLDTGCNHGVCIPVLTPDRVNKRQNGRRFKEDNDPSFTITTQDRHGIYDGYRIRRLTPRECFRLQDFPDTFKFVVSDSQLYKQAGNSITVRVLEKIIEKLPL